MMKRILSSMAIAAVVALAGSAYAQNLNIVSWGGAYTASQQKAYHDPYMKANPGVKSRQPRSGGRGRWRN